MAKSAAMKNVCTYKKKKHKISNSRRTCLTNLIERDELSTQSKYEKLGLTKDSIQIMKKLTRKDIEYEQNAC